MTKNRSGTHPMLQARNYWACAAAVAFLLGSSVVDLLTRSGIATVVLASLSLSLALLAAGVGLYWQGHRHLFEVSDNTVAAFERRLVLISLFLLLPASSMFLSGMRTHRHEKAWSVAGQSLSDLDQLEKQILEKLRARYRLAETAERLELIEQLQFSSLAAALPSAKVILQEERDPSIQRRLLQLLIKRSVIPQELFRETGVPSAKDIRNAIDAIDRRLEVQ